MSFIVKNNVWWRIFVLALFIIAMLGSWTFDMINVPAQYPCDLPFVRLYGDFCGLPMSGFETIKWFGGGVFYIFGELIKGNFASLIPQLVLLICIFIVVFPFFSNLLLIQNRNSRRLQIIHVLVWGMACLFALTMFVSQTNQDQFAPFVYSLWGLWSYILLALGAIVLEILVFRSDRTPGIAI